MNTTAQLTEAHNQVGWRGRRADVAALVLRVVIGVVFVVHGAEKLFGAFGGSGLNGTATGMARLGLEPGMFFAVLAGVAELGGGILLLVGLLTSFAGLAITGVMAVAIVVATRGALTGDDGFEYNLSLIAIALALVLAGPGRLSLDHRLGLHRLFSRSDRGPR